MGLFDSIDKMNEMANEAASDKANQEAIASARKHFEENGVDTSKMNINRENEIYMLSGTVEEGEQLAKVQELIEASSSKAVNQVELEDLSAQNISMKVKTKGSNLNVRQGASTENDIVGKFANGSEVTLVKKHQKDWYEVKAGDVQGYCHTDYLEMV